MEDVYKMVGTRLRAIRGRRELTQQVVSERAGISSAFLSFLENGRKKGSLETYHKLAGALEIRLDELFREAPPPALAPAADYGPSLKGLKTAERKAVFALVRSLRKRR